MILNKDLNERISELGMQRATTDMTWDDIAAQVSAEFNIYLTGEACRKRASRLLNSQMKEPQDSTYFERLPEVEDPYNLEYYDYEQFNRDLASLERTMDRRVDREKTIILIADRCARIVAEKKSFNTSEVRYEAQGSKEAILLLSDWHYGITIDNIFNKYNPEICERRVHELLLNVIDKIKLHKISHLHVLNLGDMIAGNIHLQLRLSSQLNVMEQIMGVSEILTDFLFELSKYVIVDYYQVLDNHSRIDPNKDTSLRLESLATITPWYIRARLQSAPTKYHQINIHDNTIDANVTEFFVDDTFYVAGVHGDLDKKATVTEKLSNFLKTHIDLVCCAHLHHFSADENSRTLMISNGSLMGTDDYAFNKRLDSCPSQAMVIFRDTPYSQVDVDAIYKINCYEYS